MIRTITSILFFAVVAAFGSQGSGIYFEAHASQGKMKGNSLVHFEGQKIGYALGDTIRFIFNGKEYADTTATPLHLPAIRLSFNMLYGIHFLPVTKELLTRYYH